MDEPTVAKPELLLLHVPLPETSDNNVADPEHTLSVPLIAAGDAITVTICVATQPVDILYVMVAVPDVIPVTTPALLAVAIKVLLLV